MKKITNFNSENERAYSLMYMYILQLNSSSRFLIFSLVVTEMECLPNFLDIYSEVLDAYWP